MRAGFNLSRGHGHAAPWLQRFWFPQLVLAAAELLAASLGTLMVPLLTVLFCVPTVLPGAAMLP